MGAGASGTATCLRSTAGRTRDRGRGSRSPAGTRPCRSRAPGLLCFTPPPRRQAAAHCLGVSARRAKRGGEAKISRTDRAAAGCRAAAGMGRNTRRDETRWNQRRAGGSGARQRSLQLLLAT